jgi:hypothetical protein
MTPLVVNKFNFTSDLTDGAKIMGFKCFDKKTVKINIKKPAK